MKITKTSSTPPTTVATSDTSSSVISAETVEPTARTQHKNASPSSQMQLLGLARQFVIDGALMQADKQPPIEDRARKREKLLQLRKQQNLESIIQKSVQYCSDSEVTDRADQDWFNSFTQLAEDVSNKTMQELWAKILAGEITVPGSFSLKSLTAFRTMSINEAKLLSKACSLAVKDPHNKSMRIISGGSQTPGLFNFFSKNREHKLNLSSFGLSYSELLTLADNHLIFIQEAETTPQAKGESIALIYNGAPLTIKAAKNNCLLSFYKFTPIGTELAQLIADNPNSKYLATIKQELASLFNIN